MLNVAFSVNLMQKPLLTSLAKHGSSESSDSSSSSSI